MFDAGLPNLFKAVVVGGPTAHAIKILRNHRMVIGWQGKPVQIHSAGIAGVGAHGEAYLSAAAGRRLVQPRQVSDYDIWPGVRTCSWLNTTCAVKSRHHG